MRKLTYIIFCLIILVGCKEPYDAETDTFEEALVVESTITNEFKRQIVKLSRVITLESNDINPEQNAEVWILDANNNRYDFTETTLGTYLSENEFSAEQNIEYVLNIRTQNGNQYHSNGQFLTAAASIDELYALKETKEGQLGVQIYIDNINENSDAKYFRYEFTETYKIVTPYFITKEIDAANVVFNPETNYSYDVIITPRTEEKRICYSSNIQQRIIQTNTLNDANNNVLRFPVRFIPKDDAIIRNRYSILVKQYVQSYDSYNFYKTLNDLGSVTSLISETQTGFVQGNINSTIKEKIVGFFDVSTKSERRVFFNYNDFDLEKPSYQYECKTDTLDYDVNEVSLNGDINQRSLLLREIRGESSEFLNEQFQLVNQLNSHTYVMVNPRCGDCTFFSSNIRPEFWID